MVMKFKMRLIWIAIVAGLLQTSLEASEENCGMPVDTSSGLLARIVGGKNSFQGQWPWQAMILVPDGNSNSSFICGGTLIKKRWILTAAHCFIDSDGRLPPENMIVLLGANDVGNNKESNRQIRAVKNYTCLGTYGGGDSTKDFKDDLCLVELKSDVTYTDYVRPACLPTAGTSVDVGKECFISGWGDTKGTGSDDILQYAAVGILDRSTCSSWYQASSITVPENHTCAGYERGNIDACDGDSGGPLVCSENVTGTDSFVLRGVTSFGISCGAARAPTLYTTVAKYLAWIEEVSPGSSVHGGKTELLLGCLAFSCASVLRLL